MKTVRLCLILFILSGIGLGLLVCMTCPKDYDDSLLAQAGALLLYGTCVISFTATIGLYWSELQFRRQHQ